MFKLKRRGLDCKDRKNDTKIAIYKTVILPIRLYESECWTLYEKHVKSLEKFQ